MIEAISISKSYGQRPAVKDVSFEVKKGEIVGFLGPNGAGKTTTMKILTGYMAPNSGQVFLDGLDISRFPLEAKKKIGYLPEFPPLYLDMYVEGFLKYAAYLKQCPRKKIPDLVENAIEKTGLYSARSRLICNLSKGFKQRVGLAQAIVSDPDILILDEPTAGLDPRQVVEIRGLLKSLKGQHTIILSTHILPEVQINCDRVIIINRGQIVTEDSLEGLNERMSAKRQIVLKVRNRSVALMEKLKHLKPVLKVSEKGSSVVELEISAGEDANEKISEAVVNEGAGLLEMRESGFNLEDVFMRLTSDDSGHPGESSSEGKEKAPELQQSEKKGRKA